MKLEVQTLDAKNVSARAARCGRRGSRSRRRGRSSGSIRSAALKGSPGIYADVPNADPKGGSEIYYDNIKVYPNKK